MTHRAAQLLIGLTLVGAVSCLDMSAPTGSPASLSTLQVPAPFVVRGDVMRDSAGNPAPLSVIAYDQNGDTMSGVKAQFFITDTGHIAKIGPDNIIAANDTTGLIHVTGQVGGIQTPQVTVFVTDRPDSIGSALSSTDVMTLNLGDTTSGRGTLQASARVLAADGKTPVPGVIVHFRITRTLDTVQNNPSHAVYLLDDNNKLSSVDTANGSGQASRNLIVITKFVADSGLLALNSSKIDTVVVEASATYRGAPLRGSPAQIKVPVKGPFFKQP